MLYPVEKLIEDRKKPVCVRQSETVRDALVQMLEHDYSQLPIIDHQGELTGIISEQSIARNYYHIDEKASVLDLKVDACRDKPVTLPLDRDIFDALDRLQRSYAIVIVEDRRPVGILTPYDMANFFRDLSEGLIIVEDIEVSLRQLIEDSLPSDEEKQEALNNAFHHLADTGRGSMPEYEGLSFGDYINLITNKKNWDKFERQLESKNLFRQYMEQVRDIRNQLAHFRGRVDAVQYDVLQRAREWLASRPRLVSTRPVAAVAKPHRFYLSAFGKRKYGPLRAWLEDQASQVSSGHDVQLTFQQIEDLLGEELPPSAREHRAWWANDVTSSGRHSLAWLEAGWKVEDVDFSSEAVTFRRTDSVLYQIFFGELLKELKQRRPGLTRATKTNPKSWWYFSGGRTGFYFGWAFGHGGVLRTELYIDAEDRKINKRWFDKLQSDSEAIEGEFGQALQWQRLNKKRACRIYASTPAAITDLPDELEAAKQWALETLLAMVDILRPRIQELS